MKRIHLDRRAFIQGVVPAGVALSLLPAMASAAWHTMSVAQNLAGAHAPAPSRILGKAQLSLIAAIAEAIVPRTETPGATDVGVVEWIDTVAAGYFSSAQRVHFLSGLAAIDRYAMSTAGAPLALLPAAARTTLLSTFDAACGQDALDAAQSAYVQLKELVLYGYFTSSLVQQDILQVVIVPGRFDASVKFNGSAA